MFSPALDRTAAAPHVSARAGDGAPQELFFSSYLHGFSSLQPFLWAHQSITRAREQRASKCSSSAAGSGSANGRWSKWKDLCIFDTCDASGTHFTTISTSMTCDVLEVCSLALLGAVDQPSTC